MPILIMIILFVIYKNNNKLKASPLRGTSDIEHTSVIIAHTRKYTNKSQNKKFQSPATSDFPKSILTPYLILRVWQNLQSHVALHE